MHMHWNLKVISTKYLISSMCFSMQCFLIFGITLIRWISLPVKTTLFVEQILNAKTTLIVGQREYSFIMHSYQDWE